MKNPANLAKHQANPKVAPIIAKMMSKFAGPKINSSLASSMAKTNIGLGNGPDDKEIGEAQIDETRELHVRRQEAIFSLTRPKNRLSEYSKFIAVVFHFLGSPSPIFIRPLSNTANNPPGKRSSPVDILDPSVT
ncbi:hypothetical protein HAX54_051149, partial [Datura stramonium]|nr:hypothetical protein [Datura stramonium]